MKKRGCEIFFAADAPLLHMVLNELPGVKTVEIQSFRIRYSRRLPQYVCIFFQLPLLVAAAVRDHRVLLRLADDIQPSVIISDNRFGFWHRDIFSVYVTHQVTIAFPAFLRWLEPVASWLHKIIIKRYDLCLVPDYPGVVNLSGRLSHGRKLPETITYIGPLSRFAVAGRGQPCTTGDEAGEPVAPGTYNTVSGRPMPQNYVCLILSGPEPQRSLLLEKVAESLREPSLVVLTPTAMNYIAQAGRRIQFITAPGTSEMRRLISRASSVIARAGYTSVMELVSLGKDAVLIPTPGQTEQEYLGRYLDGRYGFVTMNQERLEHLAEKVMIKNDPYIQDLPDPVQLFEKAAAALLEQKKK